MELRIVNVEGEGGLLDTMSAEDLLTWHEYWKLNPFGQVRADWRAGNIAAAVYNVNIDTKKSKPFSASDFIYGYDGKKERENAIRPITNKHDYDNEMRKMGLVKQAKAILLSNPEE